MSDSLSSSIDSKEPSTVPEAAEIVAKQVRHIQLVNIDRNVDIDIDN